MFEKEKIADYMYYGATIIFLLACLISAGISFIDNLWGVDVEFLYYLCFGICPSLLALLLIAASRLIKKH
jgi:hypothetical protein